MELARRRRAVGMSARGLVIGPVDDEDAVAERDAQQEGGREGVDAVGEAGEGVHAEDQKLFGRKAGGSRFLDLLKRGIVKSVVFVGLVWRAVTTVPVVCVGFSRSKKCRRYWFGVSIPTPLVQKSNRENLSI